MIVIMPMMHIRIKNGWDQRRRWSIRSTQVLVPWQPDPDPPHDTVTQDEIEDKIEFHSTTSYSHRATLLQDLDTCDVYMKMEVKHGLNRRRGVIHKVSTS